ncbi:MFS transporter [Belliella aquatica]|uniref:ATP/ADP translocase n=1 Tax=Belliella aquatica TaxID=1323734 RepID=A0ABQ1MIC3_9BACT|nr:MFS transporter [Belliella aquatica]MCH7406326.1 hypothetical protein [Belliella aquatica]GGC37878.1 hypothetical protein GCM10010993_15980 [Belliella aquatica]
MKKTKSFKILSWMILLSLALGVFISYFFVFVNALFISEIGTSQLPLAYVISGIGGICITYIFNKTEKRWGFAKSSSIFCLFFALVMCALWYMYTEGLYYSYLIFFAYAWFWISINFTSLVFWKLPSNLFDLSENKKYNSIISTGEVISAIIAYLSVPALLNLESFTRDKLLLISFIGISLFAAITFYLGDKIEKKPQEKKNLPKESNDHKQKQVIKEPYFQFIFYAVFLAVIIQLLIDFSLMEVSANLMTDPDELAKYFAFLFGGMRLLELILKSFVSKFLVREYGVFISLSTMIFALALIAIIGISSLFIGYIGMILIVASLSKVFERSLYRAIYAPTINVLYQAYPIAKRTTTQNYADGYGKTLGQFVAALFIYGIASITSFEKKIFILLLSILVILAIWYLISKKLIYYYKIELSNILDSLGSYQIDSKKNKLKELEEHNANKINPLDSENKKLGPTKINRLEEIKLSIASLTHLESVFWGKPFQKINSNELFESKKNKQVLDNQMLQKTEALIYSLWESDHQNLMKLREALIPNSSSLDRRESPFLKLVELLIHTIILTKDPKFNFYNFQKKIKSIDFLYSAVIQNLSVKKVKILSNQDYFYLLEERIQKYTYLLMCYQDLQKSSSQLSELLLFEATSVKSNILLSLAFQHDPEILNRIITMLNKADKSQEVIALELLELVLKEQEKKWILPIFKEEKYDKVLQKLSKDFPQVSLSKEKRLLSMLGNQITNLSGLVKSQVLSTLMESFPSKINRELENTFKKHVDVQQLNLKLPCRNENSKPKSDHKISLSEGTVEQDFSNRLEREAQPLSYRIPLESYYWTTQIKQLNDDIESGAVLKQVYKTLYQAVFPLNHLN